MCDLANQKLRLSRWVTKSDGAAATRAMEAIRQIP